MKKAKSHSGAKKRFRKTGSGKIVGKKVGRKHNLSHKARSRMRRLERGVVLTTKDAKTIATLLPHA
jgi:large subunit ribosomal protein L35